jgi:hypothetical protein
MNPQPDEPMSQAEIDRIAALYRETSGEQPSPRHDAQILAAVRADLAAAANPKAGALRKWRVPVAFAATLLLTVALTITVEREHPLYDTVVPALPAPKSPVNPAPAAGPNVAAPSNVEQSLQRAAPRAKSAPAADKLDAPAAAPAALEPPAKMNAVPPPALPAESPKPLYVPSPIDGGNAPDAAPAQPAIAPALRKQLPAPPAPASAPSPLFAPGQPAGDTAQKSRANATGAGVLRERDSGVAQAPLTPQEWVDKIRALRRAGRDIDADATLRQFKLAFPDYPVPEDIAAKP